MLNVYRNAHLTGRVTLCGASTMQVVSIETDNEQNYNSFALHFINLNKCKFIICSDKYSKHSGIIVILPAVYVLP